MFLRGNHGLNEVIPNIPCCREDHIKRKYKELFFDNLHKSIDVFDILQMVFN